MTTSIRLCVWVCLLLAVRAVSSFGCTLISTPATRFNPSEFIFRGEVVGYSGPLTNRYVAGEVWGVVVRPLEKVYLPSTPAKYFEVYLYNLEADCSVSGVSRLELSRRYPAGSEVNVIAEEARNLEGISAGGNLKLVVPTGGEGGVFRIKGDRRPPSVEGVYDYKNHLDSGETNMWLTYEVRKDLLRLWKAANEGEKQAVLERLLYYPYGIDFARIVDEHLRNKAMAGTLKSRREEWERSRAVGRER